MLRLTRFLIKIPVEDEDFLLAINGLNGSLDAFFDQTRQFIENPRSGDPQKFLSKKIISYLKSKKYLLTAKEEHRQFQKLVKKLRSNNKAIKHVFVSINPTEECNLACPYCVNASNRASVIANPITAVQVKKIFSVLDLLKKKKGVGVAGKCIKMLGGEPLLLANRPTITAIARECKSRQLKIDITTNGTYVIQFLDLFKEYPKVFSRFQITLDGPREIHNQRRRSANGTGYFDQVISGVDALLKMRKDVTLRSNFDNSNIECLPEVGKLIKQMGWQKMKNFFYNPHPVNENYSGKPDSCLRIFTRPHFLERATKIIKDNPDSLSFLEPADFAAEPEELFLKAAFPKRKIFQSFPSLAVCATSGVHSFTFASDNKIYACNASVGIKEFCLGEYYPKFRLYKDAIKVWKNRFADKIIQCRKCKFIFLCGGNCPMACFQATGRIDGVEKKWCDNLQKELETAAQIFKEPIKKRLLADRLDSK